MALNSALYSKLKKMVSDVADLPLDDAVERIEQAMSSGCEDDYRVQLIILKSNLLRNAGKDDESLDILLLEYETLSGFDSINYSIGERLVVKRDFNLASDYLGKCLKISANSSETWYVSSALLLRAYCAAMVGDFGSARRDLEEIEDGVSLPWLKLVPSVSKESVLTLLERADE